MSSREELKLQEARYDAAFRRRLLLIGASAALVVVVFATLQKGKQRGAPQVRDQAPPTAELALPPLEVVRLAAVRDAALEDQVLLEPEPYAHVAQMGPALLPDLLKRLGEPAFPFAEAETRAAELRGRPFRARGTLVAAERLERTESSPAEYWAHVRCLDGAEFLHVSTMLPEDPFFAGDFVLADGYFFKLYSRARDGERRTLPLFVGRKLLPSVRPLAPASKPDPVALANVYDPPLEEDQPRDEEAMWHLMNVVRTLQSEPAALDAAFAQAPWLDVVLYRALDETPAAYRGAPIRVAGFLSLGEVWPLGENPLGIGEYSEAWLANINFGDHRVLLRAPGRVNFRDLEGIHEFRAYFQQMWSYPAQSGDRFRVPVFVFADARPVAVPEPRMTGALTWFLVGLAIVLAGYLWWQVRRDQRRSREAEARLLQRRRQRREAGA